MLRLSPFPTAAAMSLSTHISDETTIASLIHSEQFHTPLPDYLQRCRHRSIDLISRQDSINWILKVHRHYHFNPVTAFLSVNYFDRFLSSISLPESNGWPFRLLSVACLSVAAKMEEIEVPLIPDLQAFEPGFVFGPKTVQRMELLVMSVLDWRLRSVTPFDFLESFIAKLPVSPRPDFVSRLLSVCSDLILRTTRGKSDLLLNNPNLDVWTLIWCIVFSVIDFLDFSPSTIAASAVLCAAGETVNFPTTYFHEKLNKEKIRSCHQLMEEYLLHTCQSPKGCGVPELDSRPRPVPASPNGVLDAAACSSCDTRSDNNCSTPQGDEPPPTRLRLSAPDVQ